MKGTSIRGIALFGIEETTEVLDKDLKVFVSTSRLAGGRLRRSTPITIDGEPGWAVTFAWRGEA